MKTFPVSRGFTAIVDDEDFDIVSGYRWSSWTNKAGNIYVFRTVQNPDGSRRSLYLHRFLMGEPDGLLIDHKDRNGLNNTRTNLRIATAKQNIANSKPQGILNLKGVSRTTRHKTKQFVAQGSIGGKTKNLGYYATKEEAAKAYRIAAEREFGEFARAS